MTIGFDKVMHFLSGIAIAWLSVAILRATGVQGWSWAPFLLAALAGALKEYWDSRGNGHVDFWDFAFTALGGGVAFCV